MYVSEDMAVERANSSVDITSMPWLPQEITDERQAIFDAIATQERRLVAPDLHSDQYALGLAETQDEVATVRGHIADPVLFTAEHATAPWLVKTGERRSFADSGTAGLTAVIAREYGVGLVLTGQQTSNVPLDLEHPIKSHIKAELPEAAGFVAVHGCSPCLFAAFEDPTEIHAVIGLGIDPPSILRDFAYEIVDRSQDDLGLKVIVGNDTEHMVQTGLVPRRNNDGTIYRNRLAALRETSSTNFVRDELWALGRDEVPALQVELTRMLRLTPEDTENRSLQSRTIGVTLGHDLLTLITKLIRENG